MTTNGSSSKIYPPSCLYIGSEKRWNIGYIPFWSLLNPKIMVSAIHTSQSGMLFVTCPSFTLSISSACSSKVLSILSSCFSSCAQTIVIPQTLVTSKIIVSKTTIVFIWFFICQILLLFHNPYTLCLSLFLQQLLICFQLHFRRFDDCFSMDAFESILPNFFQLR